MILDKLDFLSDSYINKLLSTGKWSDHGSDLNAWLDECEDIPDRYFQGDIFELKDKEDFILFFKRYLSARFDYCMRFLVEDLSKTGILTLNRAILVYPGFKTSLTVGEFYDFGVYWSTSSTIPYGAAPDAEKEDLFLICEIRKDQVDIRATMEARMDYIHGDYEMEIQIKRGEKVKLLSFD